MPTSPSYPGVEGVERRRERGEEKRGGGEGGGHVTDSSRKRGRGNMLLVPTCSKSPTTKAGPHAAHMQTHNLHTNI